MFRTIVQFIFFVGIVLSSPFVFASEDKLTIEVQLQTGKTLDVAVFDYINHRGQREMRFETDDMAGVVLGYGRDINGNGTVEAFFIFGEGGMTRYVRENARETSWDRARIVLSQHARHSGKDYFSGIKENILSFFFFGADHIFEAQRTFYMDWMDLEELSMVLEANKTFMSRDEYRYGLQLLIDGNQIAYDRLMKALGGEQAAMWGVDLGLWLSGTVLLKWAGRAVKALGKKLAPEVSRLSTTGAVVATRITVKSYQATVHSTIKSITLKSALNKSKQVLIKGLKNIRAEWKYLAFSTGIQVGVETVVNIKEVFDPNPKKLAQNLMENPAIQENVAISVAESIMMAGASGLTNSKVGRFALLGMVGASSSYAVGTALDGDQSRDRLLLDTAWSVGVDSAQFMIDLHVLHKFTQLAVKAKNPKLKLVGYAIVFVSQVAGFYGYSHASRMVDPKTELQEGQVQLVPVTVAMN